MPEWGAKWAADLRARMRNGFGEERREIHSTHSLQGKLAVFSVLLFGFGWSVLAWDLSMGLSLALPEHAVQLVVLHGRLALRAHAVRAARARVERAPRHGADGLITETHFHDIGKLCFAFTAFWGYLTFGQYLVIWYGNMGEETFFMRLRLISPWKWVTVASVVLVFFAPFFGLLSRAAKVNRAADDALRAVQPRRHVADAVHRGLSVDVRRRRRRCRSASGRSACLAAVPRRVGLVLHRVHERLPAHARDADTSPYRDEVQVPVNPETMEPLPAHE